MRRTILAVVAVLLLGGLALADGVPDPIISPRGGSGGSYDWSGGAIPLQVNAFEGGILRSNCTETNSGFICGTANSPILATVALPGGADGHIVNQSGMQITDLLYTFGEFQQGPFSTDSKSLMPNIVTIEPGISALLFGGTIYSSSTINVAFTNGCDNIDVAFTNGCDNDDKRFTGWYNFFAGVNVPQSGVLNITLQPNAVPEPGSLSLALSGMAGAVWAARKRWIR